MLESLPKVVRIARSGVREGSQLDLTIRRFKRNKLAVVGLVVTIAYVTVGLVAPHITPYDPAAMNVPNQWAAPSLEHPLGTDQFGRDMLSRVILGTRISLTVGALSISFATVVGTTLGLVAGYYRGRVDEAIMRGVDIVLSFPSILLALVVIAVLGPGLSNTIIALGIVYVPSMTRITRGSALSVREEEYVMAARAYGESATGIMLRDMLPNLLAAVLVQATVSFAFVILSEAALSFLGLGAQPPTPSWGILISQGQESLQRAPWVSIGPGLAIMATVMGLNFLGDGLRDALDPTDDVGEDRGRA